MSYICGTTASRSKNAAPNEYGHLWEEIGQNRPSTVKEKFYGSGKTCLDRNRDVCATASVYEIAPEADSVTRTYQTKATLANNASQMLLGSTVVGRFAFTQKSTLQIPASALTMFEGKPAVCLVDPSTQWVSLRPVEVALYTTDKVVLLNGLNTGDRIVPAGVSPGQRWSVARKREVVLALPHPTHYPNIAAGAVASLSVSDRGVSAVGQIFRRLIKIERDSLTEDIEMIKFEAVQR